MSSLGASRIPNPHYAATRFHVAALPDCWPAEFVIITAYEPTGQEWSETENHAADESLSAELEALNIWRVRIIGYSPNTGHAESGWAVELPIETGRELGRHFHQDAIFLICGDDLGYVHCTADNSIIWLGRFRERIAAS